MKYLLSLFLTFFSIYSVSAYHLPISEYLPTEGENQGGQNLPQIQVDQACPKKQVSISFQGGSYAVGPYYSGILKALAELFNLDNVKFLGDSSGSICALAAAIQAATKVDTYKLFNMIGLQCIRDKENLPFKGIGLWKQFIKRNHEQVINNLCPTDEDKKKLLEKINGRLYIAVTEVEFYEMFNISIPYSLKGKLISQFGSVDDLLETMTASCQIPYLLRESFFTQWRGKWVLDGGFTLSNPTLDDKTCLDNKTCIVNLGVFRQSKINKAPFPTVEEAEQDYDLGYEDAKRNWKYFSEHGLPLKEDVQLPEDIESALEGTEPISSPLVQFDYTRQLITTVYFMFKNIFLSQMVRRDNFTFLLTMYAFWKVSKDIKRYIPPIYELLGYGLKAPKLL